MDREQLLVPFCQEALRIPSYSGREEQIARFFKGRMEEYGFDEVRLDRYGSVLGILRGSRPGPTVLLDGHIDTVDVIDAAEWTYPPFGGELHGGRIYGRGASDMKGSDTAMISAAAQFAEDTGRDFAGTVCVSGTVHEECFEGVSSREITGAIHPDFVIVGEATTTTVKTGQRGRAEVVVETEGKSCHSSNPEKGANAVYHMMAVIAEIRKIVPNEHPILGKGILELTDIKSSPYPGASVVPSYCRATYDRRLLVGETRESGLAPIQKLLDELMAKDPSIKAKVSYAVGEEKCYTGETICGERFFPGWLYDEKESFVQDILAQLHAIGQTPEVTQYSFCTNGSHYAGEAGIKTIGLGPSPENLAHTDDEYIPLEQLYKVCESYGAVMKALAK